MRNELLLLAALLAATTLTAQEKKPPAAPADAAGQAPPNPKVKEHDALKSLVGDWDITCKETVPGSDQPTVSKATEHAELVCNGLHLKSSFAGTSQGKPFEGLWIVGFDSGEKKYTSVFVTNDDTEPPSIGTGTYDEKTRTWNFVFSTSKGPARSTLVFKDNDNSVETCFAKGPDGKEFQCTEVTRKRASKPATPAPADASAKGAPAKELEGLYEGLGTWNAVVKTSGAGPASEETATEKCVAICAGKWIWTDFNGTMNGPFEGHALTGYDPIAKKYVSFWIDSQNANYMKTTGTYDAAKRAYILDGTCKGGGKTMQVHQVFTQPDPNTRVLNMTFKDDSGVMQMDINYKRAGK